MHHRIKNLFASIILLISTYLFYLLTPFYQDYFSSELVLFSTHLISWNILQFAFILYGFCLLAYYFLENTPQIAKSIYCLQACRKIVSPPFFSHKSLTKDEKLGLLSFLLKAFFAPLMVVWLTDHTLKMFNNGYYIYNHMPLLNFDFISIFNTHGFWFLLQIILFLDVFFYTLGYLIELPILNNKIRSIDTNLLGWAAALACYPPFNQITVTILGWQPVEFPQFDNIYMHISINILLLGLMAIYTSASIALNFKASNLTHRGIIASGPYRFIRHPAYFCKNMAWWLAAIPALMYSINLADWWAALLFLASISGWASIYILRALTEEDHLRSVDQEYDRYCKKVKYRFIPGVY